MKTTLTIWGLLFAAAALAQQLPAVPRVTYFNGMVADAAGKAQSGTIGITFSLYEEQQGGAALWSETQNVVLDEQGRYTVLLGSGQSAGLPLDLFASGKARWLGVAPQLAGIAEQPRVLLVGVPYALKAADADTLGGLPASAFLQAAGAVTVTQAGDPVARSETAGGASPASSSDVTTTGGTVNAIPLFTTSTNIQNSILTQTGTTTANVNGTLNLPALGTATSSKGFNSQAQEFVASSFDGSSSAVENQTFKWQAEPVANDTANPSGTLNLLYGLGTTAPAETGLKIAGSGQITFASGQAFPGTIAGVTAGTGLTGGGTSGAVTLTNSGILALTVGTGLSSTGGQSPKLSINSSVVPELSAANTFTGNLSTKGELAAGGTAGGKTAPGTMEVDAGDTNTGTSSPGLNFGGGGEAIGSDRAGTINQYGLDFYTNYIARMSVTNTGSVGIGTTAPSHLLEVDAAATTAQMAMVSSGTDAAISLKNTGSGGREYWIDSGSGTAGIGSGNFAVWDATAGMARLAINSSGYVGIGTASPQFQLQVQSSNQETAAIQGVNGALYGTGVDGFASSSLGPGEGVLGATSSNSAQSYGVFGSAENNTSSSAAIGVYGQSSGGEGVGVFGQYGSTESTTGQKKTGPAGVWGDGGPDLAEIGVLGTSDDGTAGWFENNSDSALIGPAALYAQADNTGGYPFWGANIPNNGYCYEDNMGQFNCNGPFDIVFAVDQGARAVALPAIASPMNWFEDFGSGQLVNGVAVITLDPDFIQTVNSETDYKVFPVPNGDCKGLYVTHKTATSFEVRELGQGTSGVAFDYRISALRKDYENVRFADRTADTQKMREMTGRMKAQDGKRQSHDPDPKARALLEKTAARR